MKKKILLGCIALMVLLSGCGNKNATENSKETTAGGVVADINATDYVKLGEYKGITLTAIDTTVTDEDVDNEIEYMRNNNPEIVEVTDRDAVMEGDMVNIDFKGMKDGVAFDGGTAEGYDLEIGSHSFIEGFEDGLIGVKVGETVNLDLTFPENYQAAELAGQAVVFEVKVNSIKEKIIPEVTDEYISEQTNGECTSVADYKEALKQTLQDERNQAADQQIKNDALTSVIEKSEVIKDISQELIDEKVDYLKENVENNAKMYGVDLETYVTQGMGYSMDEFEEQCNNRAKSLAEESLIIHALAEIENITATDEEIVDKAKEYSGDNSEEILKNDSVMDQLKELVITEKVAQFIIDNAKIENKQ